LIVVDPLLESKIRFPLIVLIVFVSSLILSKVPTPVTLRLLMLTCWSNVAIPVTFKFFVVVPLVTFRLSVVVTPITFKYLVVVSPPTPRVAMVAIPVTFKSLRFVWSIFNTFAVKIPIKAVVAVINPTDVIPVRIFVPPLLPIVRFPEPVSIVLSFVIRI